jgi:lipopolysaccharide biosynthesis glycosyltransferase
MLPGLHATLGSLVKNLGRRDQVSLTVFIEDISEAELETLKATITEAGGVGTCVFKKADTSAFKDLKTLHGQWMTYLRLLLPNLLADATTILYLDSDLIINTDACAFFDHRLENFPVAAVDAGEIEWALDHKFQKSIGLTDQDKWFNAGVLVLNAELWRRDGLIERSLEMARTHNDALTSHDQSVLNALFSRNFHPLPAQFNMQIAPTDKPLPDADCIYHFVGSPKPWDPLGKYFHRNWKIWNGAVTRTQFRWSNFLSEHLGAYLKRAWSLRRSYIRTWLRR